MSKKLAHRSVLIVGGGLTAALVARQLVSNGVDVLVLERGIDRSGGAEERLPSQRDELRWDHRQGLMQNWAMEAYTLRHSVRDPSLPVRWMEAFLPGEGLGGAAAHWAGSTWRWAEYDPCMRSHVEGRYGKHSIPEDMPIQDWGVTYAQMEPYHYLFEKLFGVSGKAGNLQGSIQPQGNPFEAPRANEYPQPPLEATEAGLIFKSVTEKLGYHPFVNPAALSSGAYVNPDGQKLGACQYCGHCEKFMCEARAKGTPDRLIYPVLLKQKNFEVRLRSHVVRVNYDRRSKLATGVRFIDLQTGEEYEQTADIVVLAAFTLSNTKLLLTSGIGKPYDAGTNTGVVGKNFCYQTTSGVNVFFKGRWINPFLAGGATSMVIDDFNNDNFDHGGLGFLGGAQFVAAVLGGRPINARRLPPGTPQWGSEWKRANADWYAHAFPVAAQGSCYPHRENFLDLDPHYTDAFGQPLLRLTFDWRANETRMSEYVTDKLVDIANNMGADIVGAGPPRKSPFDTRQYQSSHLTGGTIMGTDPKTSVLSSHLQHWDAHNVFVVGASVYSHNSGYNPTGPLAALALRLGDDLLRYSRQPAML